MLSLKINLFTNSIACLMQALPAGFRWLEGVVCKIEAYIVDIERKDDKSFALQSVSHSTIGNLPRYYTSQFPTC